MSSLRAAGTTPMWRPRWVMIRARPATSVVPGRGALARLDRRAAHQGSHVW